MLTAIDGFGMQLRVAVSRALQQTVLRSATSRSAVSHGLKPTFSFLLSLQCWSACLQDQSANEIVSGQTSKVFQCVHIYYAQPTEALLDTESKQKVLVPNCEKCKYSFCTSVYFLQILEVMSQCFFTGKEQQLNSFDTWNTFVKCISFVHFGIACVGCCTSWLLSDKAAVC